MRPRSFRGRGIPAARNSGAGRDLASTGKIAGSSSRGEVPDLAREVAQVCHVAQVGVDVLCRFAHFVGGEVLHRLVNLSSRGGGCFTDWLISPVASGVAGACPGAEYSAPANSRLTIGRTLRSHGS